MRLPIEGVDGAVLSKLGGDVLRPAVVLAVIDGVLEELKPAVVSRDVEGLREEQRKVERRIRNLTDAVADTRGELSSLVTALQVEERRRDELGAEIIARGKIDIRLFDRCAIEAEVRRQLGRWQELLATRAVSDGRQLLRETLAGPLRMTPVGRSFRFEGEVRIGHLLAGLADVCNKICNRDGVLRKVGT